MTGFGACPRCTAILGGAEDALACPRCGGVFVRKPGIVALLDALRTGQEVRFFSSPYRSAPPPTSEEPGLVEATVKYLHCPICQRLMNRKRIVKRLECTTDLCLADGIWFDAGELARITEHVRSVLEADPATDTTQLLDLGPLTPATRGEPAVRPSQTGVK